MQTMLKRDVGFEHPAKGPHHCSECIYYTHPEKKIGQCDIVLGNIEPKDWCREFEEKESGSDKD